MNIENFLEERRVWLVTGCAGFIGSHIVEKLLSCGQSVRGIDNLSSGSFSNIEAALKGAGKESSKNFAFYEGDILDNEKLRAAAKGAQFIIHHAALASVPESINNPALAARVNVEGFAAVAQTAADLKAERVIYASSSAVYGDDHTLPKREDMAGKLLSPYAASKKANELFAEAFSSCYGLEFVGLRYFNVFGPRQDPKGPYAAVIPLWIDTLIDGRQATINGDAGITRDFTYVENAVDANINAAFAGKHAVNTVYNIADGKETSLKELLSMIVSVLKELGHEDVAPEPLIGPPRPGDIKHSCADISKAGGTLGYSVKVGVHEGLRRTIEWARQPRSKG